MMKRLLPSVLICSSMILGTAGADAATSVETPSIPDTGYSTPGSLEYNVLLAGSETVIVSGDYKPGPNSISLTPADLVQPMYLSNTNTFNFYDILDTEQEKLAYRLMEAALKQTLNVQEIEMQGVNELDAVRRAYCAFVSDYPEYFWLYDVNFTLHLKDNEDEVEDDDDKSADDYSPDEIKYITLKLNCCLGQTFDKVDANYKEVTNKVSKIVSDASKYTTDYEKIKYFAEYICENTEYNYDAAAYGPSQEQESNWNSWNAYGALINGSGVCEAYAEAFKLLCDGAGIPCTLIYSDDHEWNAVKVNNKWYYVDTTFMDTNIPFDDTYGYGWILAGTEAAGEYDNAGSHEVSGSAILDGGYSNFTYPDISEKSYKLGLKAGDLNGDGKINNKDLVLLRYDVNVDYGVSMPTLYLPLEIAEVRDLNEDGYVDSDDVDILKEWLVS